MEMDIRTGMGAGRLQPHQRMATETRGVEGGGNEGGGADPASRVARGKVEGSSAVHEEALEGRRSDEGEAEEVAWSGVYQGRSSRAQSSHGQRPTRRPSSVGPTYSDGCNESNGECSSPPLPSREIIPSKSGYEVNNMVHMFANQEADTGLVGTAIVECAEGNVGRPEETKCERRRLGRRVRLTLPNSLVWQGDGGTREEGPLHPRIDLLDFTLRQITEAQEREKDAMIVSSPAVSLVRDKVKQIEKRDSPHYQFLTAEELNCTEAGSGLVTPRMNQIPKAKSWDGPDTGWSKGKSFKASNNPRALPLPQLGIDPREARSKLLKLAGDPDLFDELRRHKEELTQTTEPLDQRKTKEGASPRPLQFSHAETAARARSESIVWQRLEERRGFLVSPKEEIIGGYKRQLMHRLADFDVQDRGYLAEFLASYRSFLAPKDVLDFLVHRYSEPLHGIPTAKQQIPSKQSATAVQIRVINVLRQWIASHCYDFDNDDNLYSAMLRFLEEQIRPQPPGSSYYAAIRLLIQEQSISIVPLDSKTYLEEVAVAMAHHDKGIRYQLLPSKREGELFRCVAGADLIDWVFNHIKDISETRAAIALADRLLNEKLLITVQPKRYSTLPFQARPDVFYRFPKHSSRASGRPRDDTRPTSEELVLLNAEVVDLAQQFCLFSEQLFCAVVPHTLPNYLRTLRQSGPATSSLQFPHLSRFLNRWDEVAKWTTRQVIECEGLRQRAVIVSTFIALAQRCLELRNFFDMSAVVCGLSHSSVSRLKQTWQLLGRKELRAFEELSDLIAPMSSYKLLRGLHRETAAALALTQTHETKQSNRASIGAVPYIAVYIIDAEHLTQVPDILYNGMINFAKKRVEASLYIELLRFRSGKYPFVNDPDYQRLLASVAPPPPPPTPRAGRDPQPASATSPASSAGAQPYSPQQSAGGGQTASDQVAKSPQPHDASEDAWERGRQAEDRYLWRKSLAVEPRPAG